MAIIGTAVAFLVGFQNNAAYGRIWEARKIWGGIVNNSRNFGMKVQDLVRSGPKDLSKEQLRKVHTSLIYRHIGWLTALRHAMREARPWEIQNLKRTNQEWNSKIVIPEHQNTLQHDLTDYLPLSELDYVLSKKNKATTILYLQSRHLRKLKEEGLIWEFAYLEFQKVLEEFFNLQGKSERIKNFPYPRQYTTITFFATWSFLILLPLGIIPQFISLAHTNAIENSTLEPIFIWLSVPFCAIVSWVFHTMERIGRIGENPFEGTPNDVPISQISRGIEIDLRQQLNEDSKSIPEPFAEDHHVQM